MVVSQDIRDEMKQSLLVERQRLEREIANIVSGGVRGDTFLADESDAIDQHPADAASELFEREKNMTVQATLEQSLQDVNSALHKIEDGTYGVCESCGKPIPEKRLRAMPEALHCIECRSRMDRENARR
ncbi:MAG TPA: TraR/DksA C4-type zinc finger protein [Chloroflexota bacterium]|nr:TraR/DksA C4-type zinc finger protein [Chloroflexota bacterium]